LLLSISAARGAISFWEKSWTVSRIASAVSPRSKLNILCALGIIGGSGEIFLTAMLGQALARANRLVTAK